MISAYLFLYLLQLAELRNCLIATALCLVVLMCILLFIVAMLTEFDVILHPDACEKESKAFEGIKNFGIKTIIFIFLVGLIPCKTVIAMAGGLYFGNKAVKAISADEKMQKVNEIINLQLDKTIEEIKARAKGTN